VPQLPTAPRCIGRDAEIRRLTDLVEQAAAGHGVAVTVEGEPGIGKTLLLDTAVARCDRLGMRVLRGRAEALERRLPFAALHACLSGGSVGLDGDEEAEQDAALLRDIAGPGRGVVAEEHEFAVTEAILDLIDRWCARGPVALVIDDVQWIDRASAVVLHRLGRDLAQQPLALVLATGRTGHSDAAAGLFRSLVSHGAQPLVLGPLPEADVAALVADRLGAPAGPALVELVAGASGNPMYVGELLAALAREGAIQVLNGVAEVVDGTGRQVPRSLVEAIQQRLAFLPRMVRRTLEIAAVLGDPLDFSELSTILDTQVVVLSAVVDEAMAAGLLVDAGGLLAFRHELIREALAQHQPAAVRAALHQRAGRVLAAAGAPVERVARHLVAGSLLDGELVGWLVEAAEALTVRAPALAVPLLRRALATARGPAAKLLRYHLARALLWAGQVDEAEQAAQAALLADPDRTHYGALHWLIAQARYRQGRVWDANATVEAALASPHLTRTEVGRFHGVAALGLAVVERFDAAETAARKAIQVGTATGDHVAIGYGYHILAVCRTVQGQLRAALADIDQAILALEAGGPPELDVDPHVVRGECLLALDRLAEADDALATAVRHNQRAGGVHLTVDYAVRARLRFLDGRWDDALAEIRTGLEVPDPYHFAVALPAIRALIAIHRGGPATGSVEDPGTEVGSRAFGHLALWVRALSEEARGDPQQALHLLYRVWEGPTGLASRRLFPDLCLDLARLAELAGDRDRAARLAMTTAELAAREPSSSMTGTALLCRGLADRDPDLLLAAAAEFRDARRPLHEGNVYEEAALVFARRGCPGPAREALDRAMALYGGLDAAWDIARASARLRQAGVGRGGRRTSRRPTQGWAALTDTEGKIALLVAEGLSNPDIATQLYLSRRTVQTHVSHILAKLGLRSRVELAVRTVSRQPI
jgi:DNA-binding CsgD family transcriptional regulator/tetratricopeptide (TPR) repeat protein